MASQPHHAIDVSKFDELNKKVGTLYNMCAKVSEEVAKIQAAPELISILGTMSHFMDTTAALHEEMVASMFSSHLSKVSARATVPVIQVSQETNSEVSDSDMDTGHISYSQVASRRPLRQKTLQQTKPAKIVPIQR